VLTGEEEIVLVGARVLNRFEIEQRLGSGGFGTVYRAWDARLERYVAVKAIDAGGGVGGRVLREAQAAARLNHPGIVTLYELGEEQGQAFLVTELAEGDTLRRLSEEGRLCDRDIGEIGADLCEALDHAHSRGIVHRDIKPQNVVVGSGEPAAKLMDFGIARVLDGAGITAPGDVLGTLAYMSPEQAEGSTAGPPADVYSLALTLYECWSGENPNLRATPAATARAIGSPLPPLRRVRPDLPPPLTETIDACLDPEPALRPQLEDLGTAIEDSLEQLDTRRAAPRAHGFSGAARLADRVGRAEPADVAVASSLSGLLAAAMIAASGGAPAWSYLLVPLVALIALVRPRAGYLAAALGLSAWLALAAHRPGAALVLVLISVPPALLLHGSGRWLIVPAAAPALGVLGAAAGYPLLAALAERWRDRAVLAATGFTWLAVAEVVLRRDLLFGATVHPPRGWQGSAGSAAGDLLLPLVSRPAFLAGLSIWIAAALLAGMMLAPVRAWLGRAGAETGTRRGGSSFGAPASAPANGGRAATLS